MRFLKNKLNASILAVAVVLIQFIIILLPCVSFSPMPTLAQKLGREPMPEPVSISMLEYATGDYDSRSLSAHFVRCYFAMEDEQIESGEISGNDRLMPQTPVNATRFPTDEQTEVFNSKRWDFSMKFTWAVAFSVAVIIANIFIRKPWAVIAIDLAWAVVWMWLAFDEGASVMHRYGEFNNMFTIIPFLKGFSIAAVTPAIVKYFSMRMKNEENEADGHEGIADSVPESFANRVEEKHVPDFFVAEEIEKYKQLLDNGVITQEEYDVKKKQLLGM